MKTFSGAAALAALALISATSPAGAHDCQSSKEAPARAPQKNLVETAVAAGSFRTLTAALEAARLVETLSGKGPFTVLAPSDEAFAKLPKGTVENLLKPENRAQLAAILTYHVIPGRVDAKEVVKLSSAITANGQRVDIRVHEQSVLIDGARAVQTDIACSNGVIHVIDQVLLPSTETVVEVAAGKDTFSTLVAAVKAAGLAEVLSGDGPFTIFAPTNEAFAKLPAGTVEGLLRPDSRDRLIALLKLHVVAGRLYSDQALAAGKASTLAGPTVQVRKTDAGVMVGAAKLIATDIDARNGVIHVIDSVLLPE